MNRASPLHIDFGGIDSVEHLVIDDKLDEIERHIGVVEKRVDPNLPPMLIVGAKRDGAELSVVRAIRPPDRHIGEGQGLVDPIENLLEMIGRSDGREGLRRRVRLGKVEVSHLFDDGAGSRVPLLQRIPNQRFENGGRSIVKEAVKAKVERVALFVDGEVGRFILMPGDL